MQIDVSTTVLVEKNSNLTIFFSFKIRGAISILGLLVLMQKYIHFHTESKNCSNNLSTQKLEKIRKMWPIVCCQHPHIERVKGSQLGAFFP